MKLTDQCSEETGRRNVALLRTREEMREYRRVLWWQDHLGPFIAGLAIVGAAIAAALFLARL